MKYKVLYPAPVIAYPVPYPRAVPPGPATTLAFYSVDQ